VDSSLNVGQCLDTVNASTEFGHVISKRRHKNKEHSKASQGKRVDRPIMSRDDNLSNCLRGAVAVPAAALSSYQRSHPACMLTRTLDRDVSGWELVMEQQENELAGQLPDCSGLSLRDLDELDGSAFAHAMRGLMAPDRRDTEAIAGFSNSVGYFDVD
jgi:FXSXX-COOH protein